MKITRILPYWLALASSLFYSGNANAAGDLIPRASINANFTDDFIGPYVNLGGGYDIFSDKGAYLCMQYGVGKNGNKGTLSLYLYNHYGYFGDVGFEIGASAIQGRAGSFAVEYAVTMLNVRLNLVASRKEGVTLEVGAGF